MSPDGIANGNFEMKNGGFFAGDSVKYICNDGYMLIIPKQNVTCKPGGTFTKNDFECKSNTFFRNPNC